MTPRDRSEGATAEKARDAVQTERHQRWRDHGGRSYRDGEAVGKERVGKH